METSTQPSFDSPEELVQETSTFLSGLWDKIQNILPTLLFALVILLIGIALTQLIERILTRGLKRSNVDQTAVSFLRSLTKIILYTLVVVICLTILHVPMTSIVAVIGAAGLAVGLALQNSLSNLAGGFIILFSKPFKAGDFVETVDASGTVESVSILYTKIITPDNKTVYIPNGTISSSKIVNCNERQTRRLDLEFSIGYENDYDTARDILLSLIAGNPLALHDARDQVCMGRQDDSAIVIFARIWVKSEDYWDLNFQLIESAKKAFDEAGICIPFPQLDVHMEPQ